MSLQRYLKYRNGYQFVMPCPTTSEVASKAGVRPVLSLCLLAGVLTSHDEIVSAQDNHREYGKASASSKRHNNRVACINASVWYGKRIMFSAVRSEQSIKKTFKVSKIWRPQPRSFHMVFEEESCRFYQGSTASVGHWVINGNVLTLRWETGSFEQLQRHSAAAPTFEGVNGSGLRLSDPQPVKQAKRPIRAAFLTNSRTPKIYTQATVNFPVGTFHTCNDTVVVHWELLSFRKVVQPHRLKKYDVVMFGLLPSTEFNKLGIMKPRKQIWIGQTGEAWLRPGFQYLRNERETWRIDYRSDWRLTSDIPSTFYSYVYFGRGIESWYVSPDLSDRFPRVAVALSNCNAPSGRDSIIYDLQQHFPVDSIGRCFKNGTHGLERGYNLDVKVRPFFEKYLFSIAMSSVVEIDWITEKVYASFHAGTIPIILGKPEQNWQDFLPCVHCVVLANNFADGKALAAYLSHLVVTPNELQRYHSWRREGYNASKFPKFDFIYRNSPDTFSCRMAEVLRPGVCPPQCLHASRADTEKAILRHSSRQRFW